MLRIGTPHLEPGPCRSHMILHYSSLAGLFLAFRLDSIKVSLYSSCRCATLRIFVNKATDKSRRQMSYSMNSVYRADYRVKRTVPLFFNFSIISIRDNSHSIQSHQPRGGAIGSYKIVVDDPRLRGCNRDPQNTSQSCFRPGLHGEV